MSYKTPSQAYAWNQVTFQVSADTSSDLICMPVSSSAFYTKYDFFLLGCGPLGGNFFLLKNGTTGSNSHISNTYMGSAIFDDSSGTWNGILTHPNESGDIHIKLIKWGCTFTGIQQLAVLYGSTSSLGSMASDNGVFPLLLTATGQTFSFRFGNAWFDDACGEVLSSDCPIDTDLPRYFFGVPYAYTVTGGDWNDDLVCDYVAQIDNLDDPDCYRMGESLGITGCTERIVSIDEDYLGGGNYPFGSSDEDRTHYFAGYRAGDYEWANLDAECRLLDPAEKAYAQWGITWNNASLQLSAGDEDGTSHMGPFGGRIGRNYYSYAGFDAFSTNTMDMNLSLTTAPPETYDDVLPPTVELAPNW